MRKFVSVEGKDELDTIRVNNQEKATGGNAPIALLARLPSDECGCPEELWRIEGLIVLIHFEEDGEGEITIYSGEDEVQEPLAGRSLDDLRANMFARIAGMGSE